MSSIENQNNQIQEIDIAFDMEKSYTSYSGSVIIGRALPDVRDGFKPVHRRIIIAMHEAGMDFNKPYDKSAAIVGDVMKKYHPHGDSSIYDAVVRMAQPFTMGINLIDGQGNFGSIDGDPAAAMRYTEVRMAKIAHHLIHDIEKNTVAARKEPVVLPAAFPNLLVNGSSGIAVGMATNIPPFNFTEIMEACIYCLENKDATGQDLLKIVKGPDFPTYGTILGVNAVRQAMLTGRGSVVIRGKAEIERNGNRQSIIISELPYQVNKTKLIEKIIELLKEKKIDGISDIRDETALEGIRVIIELKRDAIADVVLNRLYKYTQLQESFGVNMVAIDDMRPKQMSLIEIIRAFLQFRIEVVTKRIQFDLGKLRDKVHILIGLIVAIGDIDRVIAIIRSSSDTNDARAKLLAEKWQATFLNEISEAIERDLNVIDENNYCQLTEEQVKAILDLRLHRLTKLEKNKLIDEINDLAREIQKCLIWLNSPEEMEKLIALELTQMKNEFQMPRRTQIVDEKIDENIEDLMEQEDMVVTITNSGYVKRVALDAYRTQSRGGKGKSGQLLSAEDCVSELFTANTHVHILFFFDTGYVYKTKVYKLPEGEPSSRGRAITNIFPVTMESKIKKVMPLPEDETTWGEYEIIFVTSRGNIRRNSLEDFRNIQSNGKIAIKFDDNEVLPIEDSEDGDMPNASSHPDYLVDVCLCKAEDHVFIATYEGKAVRFPVDNLRVFKSRTSNGVRAIRLSQDDYVISASILGNMQFEDVEVRDRYLSIAYENRMKVKSMSENEFKSDEYDGFDYQTMKDYAEKEQLILSVTENGFGKMTSSYDYRVTNRGGSGVVNISTSIRNGGVVGSCPVEIDDNIMLITNKGKIIRINVSQIRISGRGAQGVTLIKVSDGEKINSIAKVYEQ